MSRLSRPPNLADGLHVTGGLIAVVDETSPEVGAGVYYVMTTAVMLDPSAIGAQLDGFFVDTPNRVRGFHWHKEGTKARQRMIDLTISNGIVAHSRYQSVARNKQIEARQTLLVHLADDAHREGAEHFIIESVDEVTNSRDKTTLLTHFEATGSVPFVYDWRSKDERLLWVADAINGSLHDLYFHENPEWFEQLCDAGVLAGEPTYST